MTERHEPKVDPNRLHFRETGIFTRALDTNGRWSSVDIAHLDADSLWAFLTARDGVEWAAQTGMVLLGHGHYEDWRQ